MSGASIVEDARVSLTTAVPQLSHKDMSKHDNSTAAMSDFQNSTLSPNSTKARSLPSTPSQRPRSPPPTRASPSKLTSHGTPNFTRTVESRTPPAYRRGMVCKYETGMKQARRRMPYTLGPEKLEAEPQRAAKKFNPKEELRLTADMNLLYDRLLPTVESETRRQCLVEKLETLLRDRWPGQEIKVSVFGSTGNRLGTSDSDVDICITTDCKAVEHVCSIADLLARNGMERVVCVSSAKVPIVKVWDPVLEVACDMNVNNPIALENTELIKSYVTIDHRFRPLAMIVKYWAKRRTLNDAALGGTLSSYTWICLVLNFLQTREPPILPSLQNAPGLEPHFLNGVNVAFDKSLSKYSGFGKANKSSLGDLLFQFFHYYAYELDFETSVMSVRLGKVLAKTEKSWHLLQDNRLCVEEPFNIGRNLANTADDTSMRGIHQELRLACDAIIQGNLTKCCEEYVPPQIDPLPRRTETFIQPERKTIIPQPPPQPQPQPTRSARVNNKHNRRGFASNQGNRRASNPVTRPATHLRDLPFQMTPQELQLQAQHQQHLLHDQLFQQYQYLQMQEQELRLQLYRHRGLIGVGGFHSSDSTDDGQESPVTSRSTFGARTPQTAPLYQARFNAGSPLSNGSTAPSGVVTNPASPLLATAITESRRLNRRTSFNSTPANPLRAHSQPGRALPASQTLPYLTHRFEVPVRQVDPVAARRSSTVSTGHDALAAHLGGRFARYDAGRRPVEYVGYYVGQSPSLSAYPASSVISPAPSMSGLAIHNGGLSPRMSQRSSRIASVSTSPASHYATMVNGPNIMTTVTESGPATEEEVRIPSPPAENSRPLIVDGSVNSPPRRQLHSRPQRSSSEEIDISVTTSEDAPIDTPSSSDELSNHGAMHPRIMNGLEHKGLNGEILREREFLSLNGSSNHFVEGMRYEDEDPATVLRKLEEERNIRQLTNALAAATISNGLHINGNSVRKQESTTSSNTSIVPLTPVVNGSPQEWQTQSKKKKNKKRSQKVDNNEKLTSLFGGEVPPQDEALRKGG